jgi:hypothetical protein
MRIRLVAAATAGAAVALAAVALRTPDALAAPVTPPFGLAVDAYAAYDPADTCDPVSRRGVIGLYDLLNRAYGNHGAVLATECDGADDGEHREGRALDYRLDAADPTERAVADDFLTWLLATDPSGGRHALARRLGVMHVIWNGRQWRADRAGEGWRPYPGPDPHTDRVHISLSWPGAVGATTWWAYHPPNLGARLDFHLSDSLDPSAPTRGVFQFGQSPMIPIVGDWDGDGVDSASAYDPTLGRFFLSDDPIGAGTRHTFGYGNRGAVPVVGDWDGDGRDNVGVRMGTTFFLRTSPVTSGTESTRTVPYGDAADVPLVGDWDGDGRDDVGVHRPALGRFFLRMTATTSPIETTREVLYGNAGGGPLVGDWDGDNRDNIGVRMGRTFFLRTSPVDSPTETTVPVVFGNGGTSEFAIVGDWDGDNRDTHGIVF